MQAYRRDIEGLRGLAVCLVVAYHCQLQALRGGFIGVDVFFVLSGYLITGLLVEETADTGRISLTRFYARRARRLLPASALVLLATLAVYFLFLTPLDQLALGRSGTSTALYISNVWFPTHVTDYFGSDTRSNPFVHTWSLAVEEQFYLIWPAVIALGFAIGRSRRLLLVVMTVVAISSFALTIWLVPNLSQWAFYSSPARAWEFAIGGLAVLFTPAERVETGSWRDLAGWIGCIVIVASAMWLHGEADYPGWRAWIPVLGTIAILTGRVPVLELPVLQTLGRLSYSWYLWHWPVLVIAEKAWPYLSVSRRGLCAVIALVLAAVTHVLVENPVRFSPWLTARPAMSLAGACLLTALTTGFAAGFARSAAHDRAVALAGTEVPEMMSPACTPGIADTRPLECVRGDGSSGPTIVLFGDSHASQWSPAFQALAETHRWRLVMISKPGCPTPRLTVYATLLGRLFPECDAWREAALRRIAEIQPAVVVMANAAFHGTTAGKDDPNAWGPALKSTLDFLSDAGLKTVILHDTPRPRLDLPECIAGTLGSRWRKQRSPPCVADRVEIRYPKVVGAEHEAVAGVRGVALVDLSDLFCEGDVCPSFRNGIAVYRDNSHINARYMRTIAPALYERLHPVLIRLGIQN